MKAITTRYVGPTYTRGSRIIASDGDGNRVTVSYDSALSSEANHAAAAAKLVAKMAWTGTLTGGWTATGMVWVFDGGPRIARYDLSLNSNGVPVVADCGAT